MCVSVDRIVLFVVPLGVGSAVWFACDFLNLARLIVRCDGRSDDLRRVFDRYGEIRDVYIPRDFYTR